VWKRAWILQLHYFKYLGLQSSIGLNLPRCYSPTAGSERSNLPE
jgi:hypothetical protein